MSERKASAALKEKRRAGEIQLPRRRRTEALWWRPGGSLCNRSEAAWWGKTSNRGLFLTNWVQMQVFLKPLLVYFWRQLTIQNQTLPQTVKNPACKQRTHSGHGTSGGPGPARQTEVGGRAADEPGCGKKGLPVRAHILNTGWGKKVPRCKNIILSDSYTIHTFFSHIILLNQSLPLLPWQQKKMLSWMIITIERNKKGKLTYKDYILNTMKHSNLREIKAHECLHVSKLWIYS